MLDFLNTSQILHTRGIIFSVNDYIFCLNLVLGEDEYTSYTLAYDREGFKAVLGTEDEQSYIASKKEECDALLQQQYIIKLKQELEEQYTSDIQSKAMNLEDYRFTGGQIAQILQNLLHNRISDLDSASTKDVIGLIKLLVDQFGLGDDSEFSRHFVQIYSKFNALCVKCNHEFECYGGVGATCPHCGQHYQWSSEEERFYPQPSRL